MTSAVKSIKIVYLFWKLHEMLRKLKPRVYRPANIAQNLTPTTYLIF